MGSNPTISANKRHQLRLVPFLRLDGEDENRAVVRRPQATSPAGCCLAHGRIGIDQNGHACSAITHRKAFAVRKSASLKLLDEAGPSRLSLAAEGIFVTSKKARHTAIFRQKSAAFCEMTLEKAFFTQVVSSCISGVVVLDVR